MFQAGDAVQYYAVEAGVVFKCIQSIVQSLWFGKLAVCTNSDVAIF